MDDEEIQANLSKFKRSILNILRPENALNLYEEEVYRYGIIINSHILWPYKNNIRLFVQVLYDSVNSCCNKASVFIGKKVRGVKQLSESYKSAIKARNYKFFEGDKCVIYFDEIEKTTCKSLFQSYIPFKQLISSIESCDKEKIDTIVNQIMYLFQKEKIAPALIKAYIQSFVFEVLNILSQLDDNLPDQLDSNKLLLINTEEVTLDDVKRELSGFCIKSAECIKAERERDTLPTISKVLEYVRMNFKNDIYLKGIADHFKMNPVYLGQLFKKQYGIYFNDYLNQLRVDEAKRLLEKTNMKTSEVAQNSGYSSKEYFVSKFEKITGVSPATYRKLSRDREHHAVSDGTGGM